MTQSKRDRESGPTKVKPGRSRFSLRNILTQTNFLATGGSPNSSNRGKDPYASFNKRHFIDSEVGLETFGSETSDNNMIAIAIDCYVEPEILPNGKYECPLCYGEVSSFPEISCCHHRACLDCWKEYLRIQITESRVNVSCFQCSKLIHPNDIKLLLGDPGLMTKYEDFMIRRVLALEPDARWCPAPDCKFAVIASGCASCPRLLCENNGCNTAFCYHCKAVWHPNLTCDAARALRNTDLDLLHGIPITAGSKKLNSEGIREEIKPCPRCQVLICKLDDGSCNHMSCAVCGAEFCWLCMKEVSDLHYLSPSGCTFWGKKPWSRKKKLMWQLGTLVGAPVGIALVAGIAVPAMIIGIPVWVGRKIHHKMKSTARYKRNIAVGSGVLAGIVISPVLAGLAVGLGVPILLAYVYGVVPISLCRSGGGCGGSNEQDVFEDEDNESLEASNIISHNGITRQSIRSNDFGSMKANQSIGDSSVDRESASIQAGTSSSNNEHINKLEIQADVISTKRHSLSSESVCISLDTGSIKGLAGSVLSYNLKEVNLNEDSKSEASCQ